MRLPHGIIPQLCRILGKENVQTDELALALYGYDCSVSRTRPDGVLLVQQAQQIAPVLSLLYQYKIPFVPRASATNHAGSCVALKGGFILNLTALNKIIQINTRAGFAVVEPGVITGDLQAALAPLGYFYAPDPASQMISTVGGNLAQNASGARCLKYGATLDHVLAITVVLPDGTTHTLSRENGGPDLLGLLAGSEGTLGVITQLKVKILPIAKHIQTFLVTFPSLKNSIETVSDLTAQGIVPRCVEAMDKLTARSVEACAQAGYPTDAEALLIFELDGTPAQIKKETAALEKICRANGALRFLPAATEQDRKRLWSGRQRAYAAMARLAPNVMVGDGTVPRSKLPETLARVQQILAQHNVRASLLFHAGDGNFHPQVLFDQRNNLETQLVSRALREILHTCIEAGGTISGEHGIGVEKRALMAQQYDADTLGTMARIKKALDPENLANPLKILPCQYREKARTAPQPEKNVAALQEQLNAYNLQKKSYVIVGKNTQLKTTHPRRLSCRSLDKIIAIDMQNYMATVQTGVPLSALEKALKKAGAYSVLPTGKETLGSAFCSGQFPGFYPYVTGIEALLPDGTIVRYGGKLMKNAAGYPLTRLWAGSQGTLGLVTQLTFKIFALRQAVLKPQDFIPAPDSGLWLCLRHTLNPKNLILNTPAPITYE